MDKPQVFLFCTIVNPIAIVSLIILQYTGLINLNIIVCIILIIVLGISALLNLEAYKESKKKLKSRL